jgi:hypothetical protein
MRFGIRHILTVIIVSVAILGAVTAMVVFQPESNLTYKQDSIWTTSCLAVEFNTPRLGELVDQVS